MTPYHQAKDIGEAVESTFEYLRDALSEKEDLRHADIGEIEDIVRTIPEGAGNRLLERGWETPIDHLWEAVVEDWQLRER